MGKSIKCKCGKKVFAHEIFPLGQGVSLNYQLYYVAKKSGFDELKKKYKDKDVYFQHNAWAETFLCKMGRKHFKSSRPRRLFVFIL